MEVDAPRRLNLGPDSADELNRNSREERMRPSRLGDQCLDRG